MKKFIIEYINIIGYVVTGLIFGLACFVLLLNFYHWKEVSNTYVKSEDSVDVYTKNKTKLEQIKNNANTFDANKYKGTSDQYSLMSIKSQLDMCVNSFNSTEANKLFTKKEINIQDFYDLMGLYQSDIVNDCITMQIYSITANSTANSTKSLSTVKPFIETNSKMLMTDLDYLKRNLQNNSSYQFSSDFDKTNIFNMTRDSYTKIESSYQNSIDLVLVVSEWFKKLVGGEI